MGNRDTDNLVSAAAGMGASALWWFSQNEDDRAQKIRRLREDQRELNVRFNELVGSGDWYRLTTGAVRDVISGLATTNAVRVPSTPIPNPQSQIRPDLTGGANIPGLNWPPTVAGYNQSANPDSLGELALAAQSWTYEENRSWQQGFTLAQRPQPGQKTQIFLAAQGLAQTLATESLTLDGYKTAWGRLFGNEAQVPPDAHLDPARPPSASVVAPNIQSVALLSSSQVPGHPFNNPNTDAAMRFRVSVGPGGVPSAAVAFVVNFGSQYLWSQNGTLAQFQPVVIVNGPFFYVDNITANGFQIKTVNALSANTTYDVFIMSCAGIRQGAF